MEKPEALVGDKMKVSVIIKYPPLIKSIFLSIEDIFTATTMLNGMEIMEILSSVSARVESEEPTINI